MDKNLTARHLLRALLVLLLLTGTPGAWAEDDPTSRPEEWATPLTDHAGLDNFFKVTENLFRGAQPEDIGFASLKAAGVKTVVNLRSLHSDRSETRENDLNYIHIEFEPWDAEDEEVVEFLRVVTDPENQPVFVHCHHGADRTGVMSAVYRIIIQGWTKEDAIEEMTSGGFGFHSVWKNLITYVEELDVERIKKDSGLETP